MMRMSVPASNRCVAKLWRSVCTVTCLARPTAAQADRQAAGSTWTSIGFVSSRPGKSQCRGRARLPIGAQDAEQLRRQHDVAVLAAFAMLDADHHPAAVDIADLEPDRLGGAQPRGVGCRQRGAGLQAGYGFEEANHLVR